MYCTAAERAALEREIHLNQSSNKNIDVVKLWVVHFSCAFPRGLSTDSMALRFGMSRCGRVALGAARSLQTRPVIVGRQVRLLSGSHSDFETVRAKVPDTVRFAACALVSFRVW